MSLDESGLATVNVFLTLAERPPLHLGVVAIEKGAFGSPSTMDD